MTPQCVDKRTPSGVLFIFPDIRTTKGPIISYPKRHEITEPEKASFAAFPAVLSIIIIIPSPII